MFNFIGSHADGAVFNIRMGALATRRFDAQGIFLVALGHVGNRLRHGGREHQRAPRCRRCFQNELKVFAKTKVQHLVGFIKHNSLEIGDVQHATLEMVAQASRRSHNDMCAIGKSAAFALGVHAANAGKNARTGIMVKPLQLALDLQRQFARGRHDEGNGRSLL